ncbi:MULTISPECIES: chorismate mutase [unclassified Chelatococcus]|uniref:chorismate mutase n=1 Tax=unclassified Chelatococcus TaxID=2638111 RepID=UPI001BCBCED7|nr:MULTISPECIES: chorismate mutase [unclassified Chelatococcus]CAH1652002.1 Chorismate mutase I [Hyphomicrobiales bacterium]MBS7739926.1 chorismate mutase [Chelatococcus sp. HY11]MBX3545630.1 chorismate mutase [Chelatococcus sp.]MCO5078774.1 chorismate mutase [Chelatococcus sp.]CAH1686116.1 Chorismate mutase I [Hyphomicrobiales bacterium]
MANSVTQSADSAPASSTPSSVPPVDLNVLRADIDRIDAAMHALLMERGDIIDRLIAFKRTQGPGSAFRPAREAAMMRRLAERHRGILPLDTAESIWRVIIGTFTYVQAPYSVHADISGGDGPMRDSARFHFGFTVPYIAHTSAEAVIRAVADSNGDLGIFRPDGAAASGPWWTGLTGPGAPKIIARLPFIDRPQHPAATPVFVIAQPLTDGGSSEVRLVAATVERWREEARIAIVRLGGQVLGSAGVRDGLSLLVSVPGTVTLEALDKALTAERLGRIDLSEIGSHAEVFVLDRPGMGG